MDQQQFSEEFAHIFIDDLTCEQLLAPYRVALAVTKAILEGLNDEIKCTYNYHPIHHIDCRIKTPESIIGKLHRRGFEISRKGMWQLQDIAGIRVVCRYVDDIYYIYERLRLHNNLTMIRQSDYIKNPKPNGYRSLHMIISVPIFNIDDKSHVPVEIQICTIGMDMWASLEHQLRYKSDVHSDDKIVKRLYHCSKMLEAVDSEMQAIHQELNEKYMDEDHT